MVDAYQMLCTLGHACYAGVAVDRDRRDGGRLVVVWCDDECWMAAVYDYVYYVMSIEMIPGKGGMEWNGMENELCASASIM